MGEINITEEAWRTMGEKLLYTVVEASSLLGLGKATIYKMAREGVIGVVRQQGTVRGRLYIPATEIKRYIADNLRFGRVEMSEEEQEKTREAMQKVREHRTQHKAEAEDKTVLDHVTSLRLKRRTLNRLYGAGLYEIKAVDFVENPDVKKRLLEIEGFGLSCYRDLEQALLRLHHDELEAERERAGAFGDPPTIKGVESEEAS